MVLRSGGTPGIPLFGKGLGFKTRFESWDKVSFTAGVDFAKYSGVGIKLAVVDCQSGEVLWSDGDHDKWDLDGERLNLLAKDMIKRMI